MKIGLLNNLYEPYERGGAERITAMMAAELTGQGHEVFLISTRPGAASDNPDQNAKLKIYRLPSLIYNLSARPLWLRFFWHLANFLPCFQIPTLKKILRAEKPDLAITHNLLGLGWQTPRLIRRLGIRHEHFLHDIQLIHPSGLIFYGQENKLDSPAAKVYQSWARRLFGAPAKIISPSRWLLDEHLKRGFFKGAATEVRPFKQASPGTAPRATSGNGLTFLFVGQVEVHKGILFLIRTFKKFTAPQARLIIAGSGAKLSAAKDLAAGDSRIEFRADLSFAAKAALMRQSDYLVVPSLCYENSPTVIYGAHEAGLRVIASDLGGIPEIVWPDDILFTPGEGLLKILEKLA